MIKKFFNKNRKYLNNKKLAVSVIMLIFVIALIIITTTLNDSYAIWNIKINQPGTNHIKLTKKIGATIKVSPSVNNTNEPTEIWKYKSSITKVVFENNIHDVSGSIETFDISENQNNSVIAHIVPNTDDSTTHIAYIQANEKIFANQNSGSLFSDFEKLSTIEGLEYFDTSQVTNMDSMFSNCNNLTTLDLSNFNTSNVTNMTNMFNRCSSLTTLDLSSFNTSNVSSMSTMFQSCTNLVSLNLTTFNTSNVYYMNAMFNFCNSLSSLNLNSFDTHRVVSMRRMFANCTKLNNLDLSSFNTSNVNDMSNMFYNCNSLENLDLSNFNTSQVENTEQMFCGCANITTTITIMNANTTTYTSMLESAATEVASQITLNYTKETSTLVDQMLLTKSSNTNAIKGEEVTI